MVTRRGEGNETWFRLRDWTRGQTASERLAGHILRHEGFKNIEPSHPLGGRDGKKDFTCYRGEKKWIGAAYFPMGQQQFKDIRAKFVKDLKGIAANNAEGMAFVTNQKLTNSERESLKKKAGGVSIEIYDGERVSSILDSPTNYAIRLEFLDIEMNKEEVLSALAKKDEDIKDLKDSIASLYEMLKKDRDKGEQIRILKAFRFLLDEKNNDNVRDYLSVVKTYFETLDVAVPVLIRSNTFGGVIEEETGAPPKVRTFPEDWKKDWGKDDDLYQQRCISQAINRDDIVFAIVKDSRHLELNELALQVFSAAHKSLMEAVNSD